MLAAVDAITLAPLSVSVTVSVSMTVQLVAPVQLTGTLSVVPTGFGVLRLACLSLGQSRRGGFMVGVPGAGAWSGDVDRGSTPIR